MAWCPLCRPRLRFARQGSETWCRPKPLGYEAVGRKPVQARPPAGVSERAPSSMSQDLECGEVGQFAKSRQHHPIGCSLVRASWLCSMMELIVPHLHQTRPTKFAVKNVNECPHDQTSLLSHSSAVSSACFGAFSRGGENGFVALSFSFVPHGWRNSFTETRATQPSRLASTPCPERRPADGVRPGPRLPLSTIIIAIERPAISASGTDQSGRSNDVRSPGWTGVRRETGKE
jgi:hypothetical protein